MASQKTAKVIPPLNVGDRVRIRNYSRGLGKIVELRGALGPGGASVYRVKVGKKPIASYIELLGSQLESVSMVELKKAEIGGKTRYKYRRKP